MSKLLLYCTKAKPYLNCDYGLYDSESYFPEHFIYLADRKDQCSEVANGKIVAECDFEVEKIKKVNYDFILFTDTLDTEKLINKSCVGYFELVNYLKPNWDKEDDLQNLDTVGYAINIKNLKIFNTPKRLDEVYYKSVYSWGITYEIGYHEIHKAPKNMMYVYNKDGKEKKIIIPVSPQEMCRIANKEQTVLVRKRVLKELYENE